MRTVEYIFGGLLTAALVYQILNSSATSRIIESLAQAGTSLTRAMMGR